MGRRTFVESIGAAIGATAIGDVAGAGGDAAAGSDSGSIGSRGGTPLEIAHRGYAGQFPENTVGAVSRAAETADAIEIDVMPTADGTVVVFHDQELNGRDGAQGLTDVGGYVWERTWDEVREAEVLESGETIPSLERTLDAVPPDVGVNVELKNPGSTDVQFARKLRGDELQAQKELWRPIAEAVLRLVRESNNEILVSSFYEAALAVVRELAPEIPIAFIFWGSIDTGLRIVETYDCEVLQPPWNLVEGAPFFGDEYYTSGPYEDVDLVSWAHERDKAVYAWTVDTWYRAEQLAAAGVDGLVADYPNLRWRGRS